VSTANFLAGPSLGITAVERQIRRDCTHLAANDDTLFSHTETEPSSPHSSLSVPIQRPFLHSTAPINAFVNQIDILSSKRGCLCQRLHPVTDYSARHLPSWIVTKGGHTPTWEVFPLPHHNLAVV
jgi:hypothetical protein